MNLFKLTLTVLALSFVISTTSSCKRNGKGKATKTEQNSQGKEYTSAYICPMHCEGSGSDKPGKCPVCGMDYKKKEDHTKDGHNHSGHDH